jgi:tetratricopeptide (TPR) repeat protein
MEVAIALVVLATVAWLFLWMRAQRPATDIQRLIQDGRYEEAARQGDPLHRAEALKLLGRFDEAAALYEQVPDDAAAREGLALSLAHAGRELERARSILQETIASHPEIQEFQALALAYVLLKMGRREEAMRLYEDHAVLLQTRFEADYTDPDDLLAETLFMYASLARESGDAERSDTLFARARQWASGSIFARMKDEG